MLQKKIDELFQRFANIFGIVDNIIIVGFGGIGRDYDATLSKVLWICRNANLKLNKGKFIDIIKISLKVVTACT